MPTKDELTESLAEANAKIAELEEGAGEAPMLDAEGELLLEGELYHMSDAGLTHVEGAYAAEGKAVTLTEDGTFHVEERTVAVRVRNSEGEFSEPVADATYRYDGSGDLVEVEPDEEGDSDEVAMLKSDLQAMQVQRDEARTQRDLAQKRLNDLAQKRLNDQGTLHGSIDSLTSQA